MRVERRSAGWNKGDETVGVCNCSGFNALLMADGTRDWGNGLHQMSLLAKRGRGGERERRREETRERVFEETPRALETRGDPSFSPPLILCVSFLSPSIAPTRWYLPVIFSP